MNNTRLDLLVRKNKGVSLFGQYKEMFLNAGFNDSSIKHIDVEQAQDVLNRIKQTFPHLKENVELLPSTSVYSDSTLLTSKLGNVDPQKMAYVYSDDVYYCGMFLAHVNDIRAYCLNIARMGYSNTCFIVDYDFKFSFTINFYNEDAMDLKSTFDIKLRTFD